MKDGFAERLRRIDVGVGACPEEAVSRAAGGSVLPPWVAATTAFIPIAYHPDELRLTASSKVCTLVREWLHLDAFYSFATHATPTVQAGTMRVTVHSCRDRRGDAILQEIM